MSEINPGTSQMSPTEELQQAFFREPNGIRLDATNPFLSIPTVGETFRTSLQSHVAGVNSRAVLLPYRGDSSEGTVWYACASDNTQLRALSAELQAFIGPAYAKFRAHDDADEESADRHALPLISASGWQCFSFKTESNKEDHHVLRAWDLYWRLIDQRPPVVARIPKSFDALRADFDRALLARSESSARAVLRAMRERFGISSENQLYLDIRLFAGLEQWEKIVQHNLLPTLVHLNLPQETYGDVLEALYTSEVLPYEQSGNLQEVLTQFRESVVDRARSLFRTRKLSQRQAVLKSFLLYELTQPSPHPEVLGKLVDQIPTGSFGATDGELRQFILQFKSSGDAESVAWEAYEHEQFDRAFDLLWGLPDTTKLLRSILRCVDESDDPSKALRFVDRLAAADAKIRQEVEEKSPKTLPRVRDLSRQAIDPSISWPEQMAWRSEAGESLDAYVNRWREWSRTAELSELLQRKDFAKDAAKLMESIALEHAEAFERIVVLWHEVFVSNSDPDPQLKPIYLSLLETLRLPGTFSDVELKLIRDALAHILKSGASTTEYERALNEVVGVFNAVRSPYQMRWSLDVCDTLAMAPAPDGGAMRLQFMSQVFQAGSEFLARLSETDVAMLRMLAEEAGIQIQGGVADVPQPDQSDSNYQDIGIVGVYSLDEAASLRAARILKSLYGGLDVRTNADHVCTAQLKSLAQRAEIFVFAWKTSKHAAYFCIKAAVRSEQALVMAPGGGTSSMVHAAVQSIQQARSLH